MSEAREGRLCATERRAWEEDGFFVRASVFAAAEVEALGQAAERCVARIGEALRGETEHYAIDGNVYHEAGGSTVQLEHASGSDTIRVIEPFHHLDAVMNRLIDDPRIVAPMCDLVGDERVSLFTDKLNLKRPREGSRFRWHQDSPYWAHFVDELERLPNVLVTLDDADEQNGCFRVVRGSHRRGMLPGLEGEGRLGPLFTDPRGFDEGAQVPCVAPAGSLVFFSPHTVHGSQPNRSERHRRALVITYQPGGRRMFKVDAKREAGADARAPALLSEPGPQLPG
jgi:ectoine hydroxylase-related dioxygenase (phytanoyl-CoA dioxygenase family)